MADYHKEVLGKHCRVCAKPLGKFKVSYRCVDWSGALEKAFGLADTKDDPDVHPSFFCHGCYNVLARSRKAGEENRVYTHTVKLFAWSAHTESGCTPCEHFKKVSSGGRPIKLKIGRPSTTSTRSAITHLYTIAPPSLLCPSDLATAAHPQTSSVTTSALVCRLCSSVVDRPIQLTTCNSLVCMSCLSESLNESGFLCPCCSEDHLKDFSTMVQPSSVVLKVLGDLQVPCSKCKREIAAGT